MTEQAIQNQIRLALGGDERVVLWRNNVGKAEYVKPNGQIQKVTYGLCPGSSDLVGIAQLIITPEHVGRTFGRFFALEVKQPGKYPSALQRMFRELVIRMGGYATTVRSEGEALEAAKEARKL